VIETQSNMLKRWHYSIRSAYERVQFVDAKTHQEAMNLIDPERRGFRVYPRRPGWGVVVKEGDRHE